MFDVSRNISKVRRLLRAAKAGPPPPRLSPPEIRRMPAMMRASSSLQRLSPFLLFRARRRWLAVTSLILPLVALAAFLGHDAAPPAQAQAQTVTLTSNIGQTASGGIFTTVSGAQVIIAQGFTTGGNARGYTLTSIEASLMPGRTLDLPSNERAAIRAELWSASSGEPSSKFKDLTVPTVIGPGTKSFEAPPGTTVTASTNYFFRPVHHHRYQPIC